jgi:hypothetical protein
MPGLTATSLSRSGYLVFMNFSVIGSTRSRNPMTILQNQGQSRNQNYSDPTNPAKNRWNESESKDIHCRPSGSFRGIGRRVAALRAYRVHSGSRTHPVHIATQQHQLGTIKIMM